MAEANEEVDVASLTQTVEGEASAAPVDSTPDDAVEPEEPGVDWSGLSQELEAETYDDDELRATEPEPEPVPEPVSEVQPEVTLEPEPEAAPQEPAPPAPEPEPEPIAAEATTPETTSEEPTQPEAAQPQLTAEQLEGLRTEYVNGLQARYQISEDDAAAFATGDVNAVLPQLAANLHANVIQEVTSQVATMLQQYVPTAVEQFTTQRETRQRGEQEFYGQWPELKGNEARVAQIITTYRQLNPKASKEDVFRDAGIQAWMSLGLDTAQLASKLQPAAAPEPAPVAPPPPSPANPGGAAVPPAQPNLNPFEALSFEFEEDFD